MQQAGVCCRPAGAGRSSGGTRTGRRHRFSSRFEAISRALQPGSKHAQPGVRTSTCTCTYNRWVWGGIKKKICRIRPLLLCGCVVHLLNYHWAGYEENLIVEKKNRPPPPCGARCACRSSARSARLLRMLASVRSIKSSFLESAQRCTSERSATCRGTSGGGGGGSARAL